MAVNIADCLSLANDDLNYLTISSW